MKLYKLRCITCGKLYEEKEVEYTCPKCGPRFGTLEIIYNYDEIEIKKEEFEESGSIWQFEKILPIDKNSYRTKLKVGGTPLYEFQDIAEKYKVGRLLIKYDGMNPTGSYKDRASALAITKAYEKGYDTIYCASTGNAASSLAGLAASTDLNVYIFLPSSAPIPKMAQLFVYGANVIPIDGSYDQAFDISVEVGRMKRWYSRNSAMNPYLLEGKKTGAMEIAIQLNWNVPDYILVGVGDGTIISSIYKGFYDFYKLDLIEKIPRIIGVQAEGADAVKRSFERGEPIRIIDSTAKTIADSIAVGKPRDVVKACKYVRKSNGFFISVSDKQIIDSVKELAELTGIFAEPAGAVSYAGFKKLSEKNFFEKSDVIVLMVTGNGLKDIKAVERFVNVKPVKPDMSSVLEFIELNC